MRKGEILTIAYFLLAILPCILTVSYAFNVHTQWAGVIGAIGAGGLGPLSFIAGYRIRGMQR